MESYEGKVIDSSSYYSLIEAGNKKGGQPIVCRTMLTTFFKGDN